MEVDKGDHEKRNSSSEKKKTRQNVEKQRQKWREQKKVQSEKDGRKEILRQRNKEYRKRMKIEEEINEQRFLDVQSQLTKFKRENENLKSFVKEYMQKRQMIYQMMKTYSATKKFKLKKIGGKIFCKNSKIFWKELTKRMNFTRYLDWTMMLQMHSFLILKCISIT